MLAFSAISFQGAAKDPSAFERTSGDALSGFLLGALAGALLHGGALLLHGTARGGDDDETTRRVSAELTRISVENARFFVALLLAVMLVSGLVGTLASLSLRLARPQLRRRALWIAVSTTAVLGLWTLRAFLHQPALLEPALGGAHGRLAPALAQLTSLPASLPARACDLVLGLGVAAVLFAGRRRLERRAWIAMALVVLATIVLPRLHRRPSARLLVLAADSLRPDRFDARTAPHLLALATRSTTFDLALSPAAHTTPAWLSILTGLYPHAHGVRHMFPPSALRPSYLDALPRRLSEAGFATSVISDYAGDFFPLFSLGFQRQRVPPPLTLPLVFQRELFNRSPLALALLNDRLGRRLFPVLRFLMTNADPERLADEVLDELARGDERPKAVVAFFSTTHVPFAAPAPYFRFGSPTYGGAHRYAYDVQRLADVTASDAALPAADVAQIRALYDGALASVDAAMGRILDAVGDETLVVLLSDHGENLFEPGNTTHHGKWFRGGDEANRVPLYFAGPGVKRGARIAEPVSLVDVAPTVAELLGLPASPTDGRSLAAAVTGRAPLEPREVFAETGLWLNGPATPDGVRYPPLAELLEADPRDGYQLVLKSRYEDAVVEAKHRMLRAGRYKLLYIPTADGVRYELYDMVADPTQAADRFAGSVEAPAMVRALRKFLARDPERELDARDHLVRRSED